MKIDQWWKRIDDTTGDKIISFGFFGIATLPLAIAESMKVDGVGKGWRILMTAAQFPWFFMTSPVWFPIVFVGLLWMIVEGS